MFPSTTLRAASRSSTSAFSRPAAAAPVFRGHLGTAGLNVGKRFNTQESRGGKSKLIFRFGLRDIPVELYPMAFVVAAACVGAGFAVGRHFYVDGLRLGPSGKRAE